MFSSQFGVKKKIRGGDVEILYIFFLEKHFFIISFRVLCYFQHYTFFEILKSAALLTG